MLKKIGDDGIYVHKLTDVRKYLLLFPQISELIFRACHRLIQQFQNEAQIVVDFYKDPEIKDEYIIIFVKSDCWDNAKIDVLEEISREFIEALTDVQGWFIIMPYYKPKK